MSLLIENLTVEIGNQVILKSVSFALDHGSSLAIIGPSGSGKTTLVKSILGLAQRYNIGGQIRFSSQVIQDGNVAVTTLASRRFGYIPQDLALWPHLDVASTLRFAIRSAHLSPHQQQKDQGMWAEELISLCGLAGLERKMPAELSGGEKQRLALARALAGRPRLLILDEPFSALDVVAKMGLISLIKRFQAWFSFTTVLISHDLAEAVAVGQTILVLDAGEKVWLGKRAHINEAPFRSHWNPLTSPLLDPLHLIHEVH